MPPGVIQKNASTRHNAPPPPDLADVGVGLLKANKEGAKWLVLLPGKGCSCCEAAGVRTVLARCATCERYYCGYCTVSICHEGQHGQRREVADAAAPGFNRG